MSIGDIRRKVHEVETTKQVKEALHVAEGVARQVSEWLEHTGNPLVEGDDPGVEVLVGDGMFVVFADTEDYWAVAYCNEYPVAFDNPEGEGPEFDLVPMNDRTVGVEPRR